MLISFENKNYSDWKQALDELAFCHYPVRISVDNKESVFETYTEAENFILAHIE